MTKYFGAQRCSRSLLPHLKDTLLKLEPEVVYKNVELLLWIACMSAMAAAEESGEQDWFVRQTARWAVLLGLAADEGLYKTVLRRYLFLKSEQGLQMTRLVRAVLEIQIPGPEMEAEDLVAPLLVSAAEGTSRLN